MHRQAGERGLGEHDAEALHLETGPAAAARRGEHVGGAQPFLHRLVGERAGEVHALAHPALLGAVVQSRRQPALADEHEVQAGELAAQQGQSVDQLVLALARHQAADADDELPVDAHALAQAGGLVAVGRHEVVHQERRPQHLRGHLAAGLLARGLGGVLADGEQHGRVAEHVPQHVVHAGNDAGQRDLGAAEEDDVGQAAPLTQPRAQQTGRQRVAELDELRSFALGHLLHRVQHRAGRPEHRAWTRGPRCTDGSRRRRRRRCAPARGWRPQRDPVCG